MRLDAFLRRLIRKLKYLFLYQGHLIDRSRELRLQNRFSEAEHILADILEKQPKNKSALSEYAQSASDQYNHLEAGLRWEKAIQGEKPNQYLTPNTFLKAAEAYLAAGWVEKARGGFLSLSPDFAEAALGIANCSLAKPQEWLTWVNRYLMRFNLQPITLLEHSLPLFFNLSGSTDPIAAGQPLVSVLMSAYNAQDHLQVAVQSILAQSWKNIELVIVNDASTDSTAEILASYQHKDPRVKVIHNSVNVGTYACRNIALDNCSGEYITSHDSDDWAHPDRIKLQVEHLVSSPSVIGNMSRNVRLYEDGKFEPTPWGTYITDRCCVSFTFRSAVVQQMFGYWDSVRVSADVELVERIYSVLGRRAIHILPHPLVFQLRRKNSLTTLPETLGLGGRSSFLRQQYKEAYQKWHKTLHNGNCRLTFPMSTRPFKAPLEISVPYTDVNENLKHSISVIDHS